MKPLHIGFSFAAGLAVLMSAGSAAHLPALRQQAQPEPVWLADYAAGEARARQEGKPIFLVFR